MADKFSYGVVSGSTSVRIPFTLFKTADSTAETGKVATDMTAGYWREGGSPASITLSDLAAINSAYANGGVKEADAANRPGQYRLDVPDAAFATGAEWVSIYVKTSASNFDVTIPLVTNSPTTILASIQGVLTTVTERTNRLPDVPMADGGDVSIDAAGATAVATEVLDQANAIETNVTLRKALRAILSTTAGKLSGAGTGEETFRNGVADTKDRVTATVDAAGNRLNIDYDLT